ncbi:hypothetical protein ONS95_012130 [Cadophora gregata]|uniref:uncharacterized protein n=1 Tax=Cadophora gregata TaxID=51156 RepID=UPI0026DBB91A|nr:uncharacterized protein ONS95_012130 [Cadophora gregata]KAK0117805.1 hypothetical protein ONS95_012130 [Cadophora gregata]KAK0122859.1 hypothetical protein ONS96_009886 [Cadophora gregata f. sp. sojae]
MSFKSILSIATLAFALLNTASAQSSTAGPFPSITQTTNSTSTLPTSLSSSPPTNTTFTHCLSCTFPPCSLPTPSYPTSATYPLLNTTLSSTPPAPKTNIPDVTTKIIVTKTADGVPAETVAPTAGTECAGATCPGLVSMASRTERLTGVLGPLAIVAGAFAVLI